MFFISEQSKCLVILKLLVLDIWIKVIYIFQFCPKVISSVWAHTIIAPFSGKRLFLKRENSKAANFAEKKNQKHKNCTLHRLHLCSLSQYAKGNLGFVPTHAWCMFQNLTADISKNFLHYLFNILMCNWNTLHWFYSLFCHCGLSSPYWSWI